MLSNTSSPQSEMIVQERIRQARRSFDLAYSMTAVSAVIGLTGAILLISGQIPAGAVTATGSTSLSIFCIRLAKDANDRLDKLVSEMDESDEK